MKELAAQPIGAVEVLVVLLAKLGLVVGWDVLLLLEFVGSVREGALLINNNLMDYTVVEFAEPE